LVHTSRIPLMRMVELFTTGPACVLGKERKLASGEPADLTIFSLDRSWTYNVKKTASKSRNSPFDGHTFKGGPVATVVAGKFAHRS
jgi:dihydroorotase